MTRKLVLSFAVLMVVGISAGTLASEDVTAVCHFDDEVKGWQLLRVSEKEVEKHLADHDDALPGETTPSGVRLDNSCVAQRSDLDSPTVEILTPSESVIQNDASPRIKVEYSDIGSGLDLDTLTIMLDEHDLNRGCAIGPTSATCEPPALDEGEHTIKVTVSDLAGNVGSARMSFDLVFDG